jgi:hypothetical protein
VWVGPVLLMLGGLVVAAVGVSIYRTADAVDNLPQRTGLMRILDLLPEGRERQAAAMAGRRRACGLMGVAIGAFFVMAALVRLALGTP